MQMKRDPRVGGTNSDGTNSTMNCSCSYDVGSFLQTEWTEVQMQGFPKGN